MLWYNELATYVQSRISDQDWRPLLGGSRIALASRPKTVDTLRQKLVRLGSNYHIGSLQDVAGVRFECAMTTADQDAVVQAISGLFSDVAEVAVDDLRESPHSGYRAVHVILNFPARGKVEVQVRTHLQGQWANMFERAADVVGREIRYGVLPEDDTSVDIVKSLISMSTIEVANLEVILHGTQEWELIMDEMKQSASNLGLNRDQKFMHSIAQREDRLHGYQERAARAEEALRERIAEVKAIFESMQVRLRGVEE
ncbi:RelA/SpoT domain-containing protein [Curtobacterium sp. AB7]|uniref:RelA/SpoT domain-containing protein n=1 Tax=Curtobacterium sp. AB7 TaxID=3349327 RepID=UPI003850849C